MPAAKNVVTNALLTMVNQGLQTAFNKGMQVVPNFAEKLNLLTVNSTTAEELYGWIKDLPELEKNPDTITWNPVEMLGQSIVNDEFKTGIVIPRKAIEDDQYGMFGNLASKLGQNGALTPDYELLNLLPLLFTTKLAYTGVTFFNTAHNLGVTQFSNKMTNKLSAANYATARAMLKAMKRANGEVMFTLLDPGKSFLIVGENWQVTAEYIVQVQHLAGGGDNPNFNTAQVVVIPGLGDAWMLWDCADLVTPVVYQKRIPLELTAALDLASPNVLNDDDFKWKARMRFAFGPGEPRRAVGSDGTTGP